MRSILLALLITIAPLSAQAETRNLACRSAEGLVRILDQLVDQQQLLQNSVGQTVSNRDLSQNWCDFPLIRSGTTGRLDGYFRDNDSELIYVVFRVEIPTVRAGTNTLTGNTLRMYAVDAVVSMTNWRIGRDRECGHGYRGDCLIPRTCEALDYFWLSGNRLGFTDPRAVPDYVRVARNQCKTYVVD